MSDQRQKLGITGCEAPCGGHPLRELEDMQRAYEAEAEAYFEALDYAYDRYKVLENTHPLPIAKVHKPRSTWSRLWKKRK